MGKGHVLLMGLSMGVPGTCFSSEFALGFRLSTCAACALGAHREQCCFCLWARAHPRAGSAQLAWLTSVAGTPERVQLTLPELVVP